MPKRTLYLKLVVKARRFINSKYMRKLPWLKALMRPLLGREYWIPTPHRVALGLSIGVFFAFSMLVFPVQMLGSAIFCLLSKGNLPVALGACWISNPFTIPLLIPVMVWVGKQFQFLSKNCQDSELCLFDITFNYGHFMVGCMLSGIILSLLTYPLYMLGWFLWPKKKKESS